MYKIVRKKELNSAVTYMEIEAPFVARKAKAGQFIIFRVDEKSERVPLTIAGYDREKGTVAIIFQKVGLSTEMLGSLNEGDYIQDFVGPLGKPTDVEGKKRVCVVGGGVGCAIAYPSAKAFKEAGVETDVIVGFRNKDIVVIGGGSVGIIDNSGSGILSIGRLRGGGGRRDSQLIGAHRGRSEGAQRCDQAGCDHGSSCARSVHLHFFSF